MSFEEKSVWIQLGCLLVVLAGYAIVAGNMMAAGMMEITSYIKPFTGAIVIVIILTIVGHIIAASQARPEKRDERDRLIECKAKTLSTHVLEVGALVALIMLAFDVNSLWPAHVLLLSLFLEEIARQAISIIFYRRGF